MASKKFQITLNPKFDDHASVLHALGEGEFNNSEKLRLLLIDGVRYRQGLTAPVKQPAVSEKNPPADKSGKRTGFGV